MSILKRNAGFRYTREASEANRKNPRGYLDAEAEPGPIWESTRRASLGTGVPASVKPMSRRSRIAVEPTSATDTESNVRFQLPETAIVNRAASRTSAYFPATGTTKENRASG